MVETSTKTRVRSGEAVYDTIREMALEYRFRPGEKIIESDLAALLGVSRTPVREALNRLVTEGLIEFRRNYGFYCRKLNMEEVMTLAEAVLDVELALLKHVIRRATQEELLALRSYSEGLAGVSESLPACERARGDEAFHARFADLSGNPVLASVSRNLNARIRFLRKIMMEEEADKARAFKTQCQIVELIREGDEAAARKLLRTFLTLNHYEVHEALAKGLGRIYLDPINMDASFSS